MIEQLRIGFDNFCYVVYSPGPRKAAVVDPGFDAAKVLMYLKEKTLTLDYIILTHYHSDHSAEAMFLKKSCPASHIVASEKDGAQLPFELDIVVSDGDRLEVGDVVLSFLETPGHTPGGICVIVDDEAVLTGDTLFIGDCGRTDLPGGSLEQMFQALQQKIKSLPDKYIVYPGHDYGEKPFDSLGNQKQTNKTLLAKTLKEFSRIP